MSRFGGQTNSARGWPRRRCSSPGRGLFITKEPGASFVMVTARDFPVTRCQSFRIRRAIRLFTAFVETS